jgi:alkylated DNA repair dioxygenase AlkB
MNQSSLFLPPDLPKGFLYRPDFVTEDEEKQLVKVVQSLEFRPFEFHGYTAKRRIVDYGWEYNFSTRRASTTREIPSFLEPLRERVAKFAEISATHLVEAVVTEYPPGAPIGWHRDVPQFELVIGVSLRGSCRMRFKPYRRGGGIISVNLEPRSAYVLRGSSRWEFEHSIPPVPQLRYSITFRTLRQHSKRAPAA